MKRGLITLAAAWLLTGCGANDGSSQLADDDDRPLRTLVVLSGGHTSCGDGNSPYGMGLWRTFKERIIDRVTSDNKEVHFVVSCHNDGPGVYYYSSEAPDTLRNTDFAGWYDLINNTRESLDAQRLVVAGHSYGGWLAMKLGLELRSEMDKLVTIDPISRVNCWFTTPGGCTTAPRDITAAQREMLASKSTDWLNVYQTRTFYLHASAIAEADENTRLNYSHTGIETSRELWDAITPSILLEDDDLVL